jgi:hypothetical protein
MLLRDLITLESPLLSSGLDRPIRQKRREFLIRCAYSISPAFVNETLPQQRSEPAPHHPIPRFRVPIKGLALVPRVVENRVKRRGEIRGRRFVPPFEHAFRQVLTSDVHTRTEGHSVLGDFIPSSVKCLRVIDHPSL